MNSKTVCLEEENYYLHLENEARIRELESLCDAIEDQEKAILAQEELLLHEVLGILSWESFDEVELFSELHEFEQLHTLDRIAENQTWLRAFRSAMPYLAKMLMVASATLLIRLRRTLDRYSEISHQCLLVLIQPKLATLNSIEA